MDRPDDAESAREGREPSTRAQSDSEDEEARTSEEGSTPTEGTAGLFWTAEDEGEPPELEPLEPGRPSPENVLFVVLGALGTVALVLTAVSPL
ncbi:DUF7312 domain-containing protein [Halopelagius longus]|uniref:DUF7312 domain-containing protein n=1 Tax=Halopelagius longus TaxID=1236180 RepID=A0A1H1D5F5_9EURY|nr:hypothetical protein [Halopelagius longus]RDI71175.1 hypothetical protein DWB78_05205 [Halopelagius longus]SDQ71650.1 hypothetical protein SAMN05216278_2236 [Halopelagius longus]